MVTAYPVKGKQKSLDICRAFIDGCKGTLALDAPDKLYPGAAFFYGVDASNVHLWKQVLDERREFYYCDNSYFDASRQSYFRVTKNRVQHNGIGESDGTRFAALGIEVADQQHNMHGHIVLCPQSDWFMDAIVRYSPEPGAWLKDSRRVFDRIAPGRAQRVREWSPDKAKLARSLPEDLVGAWALVTHSSAAAVTALLSGLPVFCHNACAAVQFSSYVIDDIPQLQYHEHDVLCHWAGVLADNQWTLDEMRAGDAWGKLRG